jgi:hypothetical protein
MEPNDINDDQPMDCATTATGRAAPTTYRSLRAFAKAIPRAHTTLRTWFEKEGCPVSSKPPWTAADLQAVRDWAGECLQPDRNEDRPAPTAPRHTTACHYPVLDISTSEILAASYEPGGMVKSALMLPEPVLLPIEAEMIRGTYAPTPDQLRAYVLAVVSHRALMFSDVEDYRQFEGYTGRYLQERLNGSANSAAEVLRSHLEDIFGADAAGTRPAWLQWQNDNPHRVEANGAIVPTTPDDDDFKPEPTINDQLATYDAKGGKAK